MASGLLLLRVRLRPGNFRRKCVSVRVTSIASVSPFGLLPSRVCLRSGYFRRGCVSVRERPQQELVPWFG